MKNKKSLIQKLDDIEKRIMQDNWDGYYDVCKKFRPLLHGLYMKLNYCAPIRRIHQYEQRSSDYEDPTRNNERGNLEKCPGEDFTDTHFF